MNPIIIPINNRTEKECIIHNEVKYCEETKIDIELIKSDLQPFAIVYIIIAFCSVLYFKNEYNTWRLDGLEWFTSLIMIPFFTILAGSATMLIISLALGI